MDVSMQTRSGRGCLIVAVAGDLDMATSPGVRSRLQQAVDDGARAVVLDLTDVRFVDSTAIGMFVWLHKELQQRGGRLCFAAPTPIVRKVLELTSIDRLIGSYDSVAAAEDHLATGD